MRSIALFLIRKERISLSEKRDLFEKLLEQIQLEEAEKIIHCLLLVKWIV